MPQNLQVTANSTPPEGFLLIHPGHAQTFLQDVQSMMSVAENLSDRMGRAALLSSGYDFRYMDSKPYAFAEGIAVIPVSGNLVHRSTVSWRYYTGYDAIRNQLTYAMEDPDVKAVVFDVNTPGGHVSGCYELSDFIYKSRGKKPMTAVVDASAYSAGYAICSAADKIIVTPTGGVGSIGVVATHFDMSGAMERYGEKVTFMYAGKHKIDGNPYQKLSDQARIAMQTRVDGFYNDFAALVARNRGIDEAKVRATEAACYSAAEAVSMGLVDSVMTSQDALAAIVSELSGSTIQEDFNMTDKANQPAATTQTAAAPAPVVAPATAATAAPVDVAALVTQERQRISAIQELPEAKGRETLASHLALKTSMSVEDAKAMLLATPAAAATAEKGNKAFMDAMGADGKPVVEGSLETADDKNVDASTQILRDYHAVSGMNYLPKAANAASVKH